MTGSGHIEDDRRLAEVVRRLREAYKPERIYLFGSMARGEAGPDSDYDLLLVVPDEAPPERRDAGLAYRVLWGLGIAVDAVVCRSSWFHARTHLKASLPGTVLREGKLLHAV
jgi:predicted nucleotidyltransferase